MGIAELTLADIAKTNRKTLGNEAPIQVFRMIRLIGMHKMLGEGAGYALYAAGKDLGAALEVNSVAEFLDLVQRLKIGIPQVTASAEDRLVVFVEECITCSGLPDVGEMVCHLESGIIAGAVERILKRPARSAQTKSSSMGFNGCEFEVHLF
ncbi:MAG: DUF2507 domain-containing protein [Deltaproteobacteria bacterium]|nr:DUF2507 domain-containing protein [Deltaproteobacteria bacterium]